MKIAIIADSHDNLVNFKKAISFITNEGIKIIIHCGDICAPATLKEAFKDFKGKVHIVFGNADDHFRLTKIASEELPQVKIWGELGEIEIDGNPEGEQAPYGARKIAFCHFPEIAEKLAQKQKYDLVFYGHTHKPWLARRSFSEGGEEKVGKTRLVNPGNLAGMFYKATFAIYDTKTDKLELKILDYNPPTSSSRQRRNVGC